MRYALFASAILLGTALATQAFANDPMAGAATPSGAAATQVAAQHKTKKPVRARTSRPTGNVVTYNRDSKNPNVGWHSQGGMRVCTQDCDNPEIPGSGYSCRNVNVLGMAMRECDWSSF